MGFTKEALTGLGRFSGRTRRGHFWPWAAVAFFVSMAVPMPALFLEFGRAFVRIEQFAAENPDQATVTQTPTSRTVVIHGDHPELMPDMTALVPWIAASFLIMVTLLAAAVTRRLHDRGLTGLIGLLPLPFVVFSLVQFPRVFASFATDAPDLAMFGAVFLSNALYLASGGLLIFLLSGASTSGPNRFGPEPTRGRTGAVIRPPASP